MSDYACDGNGRLASASDSQSAITYTYDANGFLDVVTTTGTAVGSTIVNIAKWLVNNFDELKATVSDFQTRFNVSLGSLMK